MKAIKPENLNEKERKKISKLLLEALGKKLTPIFGKKILSDATLAESFSANNVLLVKEKVKEEGKDEVIAFLGIKDHHSSFIDIPLGTIFQNFGIIAFLKAVIFGMLEYKPQKNELHIEVVAVDSNHRGKGLGSSLIQEFENYARNNNLSILSLEVVDTNPKALKLYKKIGFEIKNISNMGALNYFAKFPFQEIYLMKKEITN